jgi:hypothetical protein
MKKPVGYREGKKWVVPRLSINTIYYGQVRRTRAMASSPFIWPWEFSSGAWGNGEKQRMRDLRHFRWGESSPCPCISRIPSPFACAIPGRSDNPCYCHRSSRYYLASAEGDTSDRLNLHLVFSILEISKDKKSFYLKRCLIWLKFDRRCFYF